MNFRHLLRLCPRYRQLADRILLRILLQRYLFPKGEAKIKELPRALHGLETELVEEAGAAVVGRWAQVEDWDA